MKAISGKNWEEIKVSPRLIEKVKAEYNINDIQAKLIISRNFSLAELYTFKGKLSLTNPFYQNQDFIAGCQLLKKHINKNNKILIIGDYDVDGCISTFLMYDYIKRFKTNVDYYIPDRFKDGYGANKKLIIKLSDTQKPNLVIFLDCGSNSHDSIKYLNDKKIDTIVLDHHNIEQPYPLSNVIINPKKKNYYKKLDYICSAFLTYLFIDLYQFKNDIKFSISKNLIYVLLATISDVMPLRGINRLLAINVLRDFNINNNEIIKNIFRLYNLKKKIDLDDLGYRIGPIFNSAGRISNANQIIELLTTKSINKRMNILEKIFDLNKKRKKIEETVLNIIDYNEVEKQDGIIFIYLPNISEGIIGIIASRIKEYTNKPCIVFTNSFSNIKGSARSIKNFNIADFIHKALKKNIIISGGGHNLAAGITLSKNKLDLFKNFLNREYKKNRYILNDTFVSKISISSVNKVFLDKVNLIGPFGHDNLNPIFLIENVKLSNKKVLQNKFISCFIKKNNRIIKAISFNQIKSRISYEILNSKSSMNVLIKLKENIFNSKKTIQVEIIDILKSTINT